MVLHGRQISAVKPTICSSLAPQVSRHQYLATLSAGWDDMAAWVTQVREPYDKTAGSAVACGGNSTQYCFYQGNGKARELSGLHTILKRTLKAKCIA
jgi:hypothetical protein